MLNAPGLDDSNFGLHFANWHIKLHCVLKSQAFHFDSRSSPSEQSPSFMVHISDTWRSNHREKPYSRFLLSSFLFSSQRLWVGSCFFVFCCFFVWNNESLEWYGTRSLSFLRRQSFPKADSLLATVRLSDVTSSRPRNVLRHSLIFHMKFGCTSSMTDKVIRIISAWA